MNSPAKDIADYLLDSTSTVSLIGFGTDLFVGAQPPTPVDCVTLFNTGGWGSDPRHNYDRPTIQALVRASAYTTGYALAQSIRAFLNGKYNVEIGGSRYVQILAEGDIHDLGIESTKHHYSFSVNFAVHRTPTS